MSAVFAFGRYLLQFYDKYDDLVTGNWAISAFKMLPDEHIVISTTHKAPYNRWLSHRAFVRRSIVAKWPLNMASINWGDLSVDVLPYYSVGRLDNEECADVHENYQGDAALFRREQEQLTTHRLKQAFIGQLCGRELAELDDEMKAKIEAGVAGGNKYYDGEMLQKAGKEATGPWGGMCTCPNGQVYPVGDNNDNCGSLACVGGVAGECHRKEGAWSGKMVECDPQAPKIGADACVTWYNDRFPEYPAGPTFKTNRDKWRVEAGEPSGAPSCIVGRSCPIDPLDMGPASCWDTGFAPQLSQKPMLSKPAKCARSVAAAKAIDERCDAASCTEANGCKYIPPITAAIGDGRARGGRSCSSHTHLPSVAALHALFLAVRSWGWGAVTSRLCVHSSLPPALCPCRAVLSPFVLPRLSMKNPERAAFSDWPRI